MKVICEIKHENNLQKKIYTLDWLTKYARNTIHRNNTKNTWGRPKRSKKKFTISALSIALEHFHPTVSVREIRKAGKSAFIGFSLEQQIQHSISPSDSIETFSRDGGVSSWRLMCSWRGLNSPWKYPWNVWHGEEKADEREKKRGIPIGWFFKPKSFFVLSLIPVGVPMFLRGPFLWERYSKVSTI